MKCLSCSTPSSDSLPVAPWEALAVDTGNGYQLLQTSMAVPLGGTTDRSGSVHHRVLKMTSMAGPRGGATGGSDSVHHQG
jgi:hypothetical protein